MFFEKQPTCTKKTQTNNNKQYQVDILLHI